MGDQDKTDKKQTLSTYLRTSGQRPPKNSLPDNSVTILTPPHPPTNAAVTPYLSPALPPKPPSHYASTAQSSRAGLIVKEGCMNTPGLGTPLSPPSQL